MNTYFRRIVSIGISLLALAPGLASNAIPAQAAAKKAVVDDDKAQCPKAGFTDIQSAINSLGANSTGKVIVCAGTYPGFFAFNAQNLKLIAKKDVVVTPPSLPYNATLVSIIASTNVTIQGFTFDGQGSVGTSGLATAVQYSASSGTVQKNKFINWHTPGYATPSAIKALYLANGLGEKIKVVKNTFTDFQNTGIQAEGLSTLTISGNTLTAPSVISANETLGIYLLPVGSGTPSGVIKGNKITSDTFPIATDSRAIALRDVGNFKISGNTLTHWGMGIAIGNDCTYPSDTSNISITGNKILESRTGIGVLANATSCDTHSDNLRITGNKLIDTVDLGIGGIGFGISGLPGQAYALNALVKGNKINHFNIPMYNTAGSGGTITGVFGPNSITP